jgi:metalloendopeptidase OMA1, mitochondrial
MFLSLIREIAKNGWSHWRTLNVSDNGSTLFPSGTHINRRSLIRSMAYGFGSCCLLGGCRSAPMTGRKQLLIMPEAQELSLGEQTYGEVTGGGKETTNERYRELVSRVGHRIAAVAGRGDYKWEFRVLQSEEQNAFCLPGGKVAVYEGILPVCENEAGLAVVMSHEIGHALARHGGERMSQNAAVDGVKTAMGYVLQTQDQVKREAAMKAYGLASEYGVLLPYSRKHELEADHIGVMLMAQAGYDPTEAPRFWKRFGGSAETGAKPPEFMSTHPSDDRRAQELTQRLPEAQKLFASSSAPVGLGETI